VRASGNRPAISDSTGAHLTYRETLIRSIACARLLGRNLGPEPYVGLLLPPLVPSAIANIALTMLGKIPVNLNYTAGSDAIQAAIDECGIQHILTSHKVLARFHLELKGKLLFLEDLRDQVTLRDKIEAASLGRFVPQAALGAWFPGLRGNQLDKTATVIFTSGSTGDPKGVVLTHRNILSNIYQISRHIDLLPDESVLGILPFFHAFGFTVGIWTVLSLGKRVVYHHNPLEARVVGDLCADHKITMLVGTPTYMRTYLQRCKPEQFATLVHLLLGAEKLKPELARDIQATLGIDALEGYGCTELSPVVAVNVPQERVLQNGRRIRGHRPGTVGFPLPGTLVKAIDPETGADLPPGAEGMLVVKGPQVMAGYLNRPEATARVLQDGWYTTGDLGYIDADGFLKITDRLSRFSKMGGEMVPHGAVETAVREAAGVGEDCVAVTALPDPKRGERLIVLYTDLGAPPEEIHRRLMTSGRLPKLWLPAVDDFVAVEEIPVLGTGKVDLRKLRELAAERVGCCST
jgi:acyl-[acyl-carrier-protein]-phospholipid O-acyltransferase/long-chain-fatty-acid--[acyl-carrier-protein] ligase